MKSILATLAVVLSLTACNVSGPSSSLVPGAAGTRDTQDYMGGAPLLKPTAQITLALFDAPLNALPGVKVNVALAGAQLLTSAGTVPFVAFDKPKVVNLIDLQKNPLNLNGTAPSGSYTGVRLLIESAQSNVTIGKMTIPIVWGTPGHPTASPVIAVDFNVGFTAGALLSGGKPTTITLDFNVMQSVRFANGTIYVQPSVTAANAAGEVDGTVKNAAGKPVSNASVLAMDQTGHMVNVTATGSDGKFALHALPPGAYTIVVKNSYVTASGETITATGNDAGAAPSQLIVLSPEDKLELDSLVD
jgi:phosphotransferase system HPr-like phosphotransfer protein